MNSNSLAAILLGVVGMATFSFISARRKTPSDSAYALESGLQIAWNLIAIAGFVWAITPRVPQAAKDGLFGGAAAFVFCGLAGGMVVSASLLGRFFRRPHLEEFAPPKMQGLFAELLDNPSRSFNQISHALNALCIGAFLGMVSLYFLSNRQLDDYLLETSGLLAGTITGVTIIYIVSLLANLLRSKKGPKAGHVNKIVLENLIVKRQLDYHHKDGLKSEVVVRIGKPVYDGNAWGCPYDIAGLSWQGPRVVYGEDGVQALLLTLTLIAAVLDHEGKSTGGRIAWLDMNDSGFTPIK